MSKSCSIYGPIFTKRAFLVLEKKNREKNFFDPRGQKIEKLEKKNEKKFFFDVVTKIFGFFYVKLIGLLSPTKYSGWTNLISLF